MSKISRSERTRVPDYRDPDEVIQGKVVIDESKCTGCALCTRCCAGRALEMVAKKARMVESHNECMCLYCGDCTAICPAGAIAMGSPYKMTKMYKTIDKDDPQPPRLFGGER